MSHFKIIKGNIKKKTNKLKDKLSQVWHELLKAQKDDQYHHHKSNRSLEISVILWKKSSKLRNEDNVLAYYQLSFKKIVLITRRGSFKSSNVSLFLSRAEKSHICLATGTGKF